QAANRAWRLELDPLEALRSSGAIPHGTSAPIRRFRDPGSAEHGAAGIDAFCFQQMSCPPKGCGRNGRMPVSTLHSGLYHGVQLLRGRPVGPLMQRLKRWDALDADAYRALAEERLNAMLEYARRTVPMYRSGAWNEIAKSERTALRDWPVLDRRLVVEQRERLIAAPYATPLGRRRVVPRPSSGSTGAPVTVAWNRLAMAWSWAAEYHPMSWHGLDIGVKTLRMWG